MRMWYLLGWLLLPTLAAAWHFGPGQDWLALDDSSRLLAKAEAAVKSEDWSEADEIFGQALAVLPAERKREIAVIRLERAKAQMNAGKLPEANADLETMIDELIADAKSDPKTLAEARRAFASSQFYMTWLLRLEGESPEVWEPVIDSARQTYKMLADESTKAGNKATSSIHLDDLEAAVKLARLDLSELQGLNLPCQCKGCKSGKCRSPKRGKSKPKLEQKDIRSAGQGSEIDTNGH